MIRYALAAFGSALLVWAMLDFKAGRFSRWAVHLGRISYGLYVFHEFAIQLFGMIPSKMAISSQHSLLLRGSVHLVLHILAPLFVTWAAAELSYRFFESPLLRLKQRFAVIASQPPEMAGKSAALSSR